MRFVRLKTVVTKLYDQVIPGKSDVLTILRKLKDKELTCSIRLSSGPIYHEVRFLEIEEDRFRWRTTKNQSSLVKWSNVDELEHLELNVKSEVFSLKPNPSRWSTINAGDLDDDSESGE